MIATAAGAFHKVVVAAHVCVTTILAALFMRHHAAWYWQRVEARVSGGVAVFMNLTAAIRTRWRIGVMAVPSAVNLVVLTIAWRTIVDGGMAGLVRCISHSSRFRS